MSEMIRINVRLSPEVHQWYKERSEKTGVSMSSLMFLACEKQMREEMFMGSNLPALLKLANEHNLIEEQDRGIINALVETTTPPSQRS